VYNRYVLSYLYRYYYILEDKDMQSLTNFRCSRGECDHRCDIHNRLNSPFSDLYNETNNNNNSYARVVCPSCSYNLYHCRQCMYNTLEKKNMHRHIRTKHLSINTTTPASIEDNDNDFGNNNNDISFHQVKYSKGVWG